MDRVTSMESHDLEKDAALVRVLRLSKVLTMLNEKLESSPGLKEIGL